MGKTVRRSLDRDHVEAFGVVGEFAHGEDVEVRTKIGVGQIRPKQGA